MHDLTKHINSLQAFAQKRFKFEYPPKLFLKQDHENAKDIFGKTAYYDPSEKSITIFTTGRHPKDILRSFSHELVHHCQNLRGDLGDGGCGPMGIDYAQQDKHMREMEREAYEKGNLCFRDWEDGIKVAMQQENNQLKENKRMVKISKKELKGLIGKLLETRLEKEQVTEDTEELEEAGCKSGPHKRDEDETVVEAEENKEEELEEGKGEECAKCKGKGCEHCKGEGAHKKEMEEGEVKSPGKYKTGMEAGYDDDGDGVPNGADKNPKDGSMKESKIQTPEQEEMLYESRFGKRDEEIFNKLKNLWVK